MCRITDNREEATVFQLLKHYAALYENRTALEYLEEDAVKKVTYRCFFEDCCRMAAFFKEELPENQVIAISGERDYFYCVIYYAGMFNGNVMFPVNPELSSSVIREVFRRRKPCLFVYDADYFDFSAKEPENIQHLWSFQELSEKVKNREACFQEKEGVSCRDVCLNLLTSGTTGVPKIVELNHLAIASHAAPHTGEKLLSVLPLHHPGGLLLFGVMFGLGRTVCLSSFQSVVGDLERFKPDFLMTVPALMKPLIKLSDAGMADLSCLKEVGTCGTPPDRQVFEALTERGIKVSNNYSASEIGGYFSTANDAKAPLCSIGKGNPYYETEIAENGELLVKGPTIMKGYFDDGETSAEVLTDGWYHTGDLARTDENGYIFISGRIRNIILLSNGENVSPEAIETELSRCEAIRMCMVKQEDDRIVAEVYYGDRKDEAQEAKIQAFLKSYNRSVPTFMRVRKIAFRNTPFETNSNGKLIRKV